ncbi:MAG: CpsB/CapC family capsule biosynthesis tyrosine phosphatase [Eubacteriales bacterium]
MIKRNKTENISYPQTDIVDFHSHILPGIDDGSSSPEETLKMIYETKRQGIGTIVATPHFYPDRDLPERFLSRRFEAIKRLLDVYDPSVYPRVYVGAEVAYFPGMGYSDSVRELCIYGTDVIMIEMPFCRWNDAITEDILLVNEKLGLTPVLAHIERYLGFQRRGFLEPFLQNDIIIQSNAEFFIDRGTRKTAEKMLIDGVIRLIGSDSHNTSTRKQNIGDAVLSLQKRLGDTAVEELSLLSSSLIRKAAPLETIAALT